MSKISLLHNSRGRRSSSRLGVYGSTVPIDRLEVVPLGARAFPWSKLPALALLLGSLWLLYNLFSAPRFRVSEVTISGTRLLAVADVQRSLDLLDQSIFHVNPRALEARLLRDYGCLAKATIVCRLPNQVTVILVERPVALVWESGGKYWWIGSDGRVLGQAAAWD
jgi:cell division septal protein FtsQ